MKRISIRIAVALLTFLVGVVASSVRFSADPRQSAISLQDEAWHRLYEAAGMSGDDELRKEVYDRLQCANKAGIPDARLTPLDYSEGCKRADGTIHQRLNDTSEYGPYYQRITSSHSKWAVENLDFVRSVGTGKKAKAYLYTQKWFFDQYD